MPWKCLQMRADHTAHLSMFLQPETFSAGVQGEEQLPAVATRGVRPSKSAMG